MAQGCPHWARSTSKRRHNAKRWPDTQSIMEHSHGGASRFLEARIHTLERALGDAFNRIEEFERKLRGFRVLPAKGGGVWGRGNGKGEDDGVAKGKGKGKDEMWSQGGGMERTECGVWGTGRGSATGGARAAAVNQAGSTRS